MGDGEGGIWREQRKKEREIATGPHMLLSRTTQHADAVRISTNQCRLQCVRELMKFSGSSSMQCRRRLGADYLVTKIKEGMQLLHLQLRESHASLLTTFRSNFFLSRERVWTHIYFINSNSNH